jgi:hypothetical protein
MRGQDALVPLGVAALLLLLERATFVPRLDLVLELARLEEVAGLLPLRGGLGHCHCALLRAALVVVVIEGLMKSCGEPSRAPGVLSVNG